MTSQKQIEANRRNALLSTGPKTEGGKQQTRSNAYRHGLTAETIIAGIEDEAEYGAFELEIVTEYDPKSVVERELTRRLASLLWRLRRANVIEAGLFGHAEMMCAPEQGEDLGRHPRRQMSGGLILRLKLDPNGSDSMHGGPKAELNEGVASSERDDPKVLSDGASTMQRAMMTRYLRLANLDSLPLERLNRYEASLWRQFVQVLFALDQAKVHRIAASRSRFTPYPPQW